MTKEIRPKMWGYFLYEDGKKILDGRDDGFSENVAKEIQKLLDLVNIQTKRIEEGREIVEQELETHREELADWILHDEPPDGDVFSVWLKERIEKLEAWLKVVKKKKPSIPPFVDC